MDLSSMMKGRELWARFVSDHPKFPAFMRAAKRKKYTEGTVIGITITDPDGKVLETNVKLTASDLRLLEELKSML